jgi:hypothetical protein
LTVIASAAKQSLGDMKAGLLRRFAPRKDKKCVGLRVCADSGPLRLNAKLLKRINAILPVQTSLQKYSAFPVGQISSTSRVS